MSEEIEIKKNYSADSIQALEALKNKMQLQAKNPNQAPQNKSENSLNRPLTELEKLKAKLDKND